MKSVAVVIPAYNAERSIVRALDSVLSQTLPPSEIIVVDDGSVDGTAALVESFGEKVRLIKQPNSGAAAARNTGLAHASASFIAFLDADDYWRPQKLEAQMQTFGRICDASWCCCAGEVRDGDKTQSVQLSSGPEGLYDFFAEIAEGGFVQTSGMVILRSVLDDLGGFDVSLRVCHDRDLWWRIAMRHPQIAFSPTVGYVYQVDTPDSLIKSSRNRTVELRNVCDRVTEARRIKAPNLQPLERLAERLARSYLNRWAGGEVEIESEVVFHAIDLFRLAALTRLRLHLLRNIPFRPIRVGLGRFASV